MEIPGYQRVEHLHCFENACRRARLWRLWRRLTGRPQRLLPFAPVYARLKQRTSHHRGIQEIPLRQIVGSLDKASHFDRSFRPLYGELRERWLTVKMLQVWHGWEPIVVHKIANLYFVEDGHHRVSVARDAGLDVIEATVIEYPLAYRFDVDDSLETIVQRLEGGA